LYVGITITVITSSQPQFYLVYPEGHVCPLSLVQINAYQTVCYDSR